MKPDKQLAALTAVARWHGATLVGGAADPTGQFGTACFPTPVHAERFSNFIRPHVRKEVGAGVVYFQSTR